ncbi:MAG: VCP-like ATPase [Candidatus Heimdallarchaeota archaeon LC_2]|nr:MAG: VCP-like ATPase [Candidatus Heimdallarchaeota archaeon LC_2]
MVSKDSPSKEDSLTLQLRVVGLDPKDYIPGRVRLNQKLMMQLGVKIKDFVEIEGKRKSVALVWPGYPQDLNKEILRMGSLIQLNCGTSEDGIVKVNKIPLRSAKSIILQTKNESLSTDNKLLLRFIKKKLIGYPVILGDLIDVLFSDNLEYFVVSQTEPPGAVILQKKTKYFITGTTIEQSMEIPNFGHVRICCYQTTILSEAYCSCGRVVDSKLKNYFEEENS